MPRNSIVIIGKTTDEERVLAPLVGGDPAVFFLLAQRIVWGLTQADLIKVNVPAIVQRLRRRCGAVLPVHLLTACAARGTEPDLAERELERARALAGATHPLRYLLPSAVEWASSPPRQELVEIVASHVWRVRVEHAVAERSFRGSGYCTIVRTDSGSLVLVNPVGFTDEVAEQIDSLGPARIAMVQGKSHSHFVASTRARFRNIKVLGTRGHLSHAPSQHVRFDGLLDDGGIALLPPEFRYLPLAGTQLDEVFLFHQPTWLLIVQDFMARNAARHAELGFFSRIYCFAFGLHERVGFLGYQPMLWTDLHRVQQCVAAACKLDFASVLGAHMGVAAVDPQLCAEVRAAFEWLLALSRREHVALCLRYLWRQPSFLGDLLRYRQAQRRIRKSIALAG